MAEELNLLEDRLDKAMDTIAPLTATTGVDLLRAPLQPAEGPTVLDDAIDDINSLDNKRASIGVASNREVSPETYAHTRNMVKSLGMPLKMLQGGLDTDKVRSQYLVKETEALLKGYPRLQKFLLNPDNQKLTHDDIPAIRNLASLVTDLQRSEKAQGFWEHVGDFGQFAGSTAELTTETLKLAGTELSNQQGIMSVLGPVTQYDLTGKATERTLQSIYGSVRKNMTAEEATFFDAMEPGEKYKYVDENWRRLSGAEKASEQQMAKARDIAGELAVIRQRLPEEGAASLAVEGTGAMVQMLPAVGLSAMGMPHLGLAVISTQAFGNQYYKARSEGRDIGVAAFEGVLYSAMEFVTEKIPLGYLTKPSEKFVADLLKGIGAEAAQEGVMEGFDLAYQYLANGKAVSWADALKQVFEAGAIGGIAGGQIRLGMTGIQKGIQHIVGSDPQASVEYLQKLQDAKTGVDRTKLAGRSPEQLREALEALTEGEQDTVFIPADKLLDLEQSGSLVGNELPQDSLPESRTESEKRNGDVEVKVADLLMMPAAQFAAVAPHVRRNIKEFTATEAQEALDNREQDIADLLSGMVEQAAADPEARPVFDTMKEQLVQVEGMNEIEAEEVAELYEQNYQAMSELYEGTKSAEELFLEANVVVRGPAAAEEAAAAAAAAAAPAALDLQQNETLRELTVQLPDGDGNLVDVNVGEEFDQIAAERDMTEQLLRCVNGS